MSITVSSRVHSKDGTAIAFSRAGNGQPIISVDGALAHRSFNPAGAELASLLGSHFTVVTYDRRGRGESGDTPTYAPAREVEDLDALNAEVGGSAFGVAMSSGTALVLDAAAQGTTISKLALYEPSFIVDNSRPPIPTDYVSRLKELVSGGRRGDAVEYFMTTAVGVPAEMVRRCGWRQCGRRWNRWPRRSPTTARPWAKVCRASRCRGNGGPRSPCPPSSSMAARAQRGCATRRKHLRTCSRTPSGAPSKVKRTTWKQRRSLGSWRSSSPADGQGSLLKAGQLDEVQTHLMPRRRGAGGHTP